MGTLAWRRLLLTLCAAGLILNGVSLWMFTTLGSSGITTVNVTPYGVPSGATSIPFVGTIEVWSGGAADRAGLRNGDLVDTRQLSPADRFRWFTQFQYGVGEHVQVAVLRNNVIRHVTLVADSMPMTGDVLLGFIAGFSLLLFAALVAWRRADVAEARALALMLILFTFGENVLPGNWHTSWPALDAVLAVFGWILQFAGFAMLATYAMLAVRPPTALRRALAWLTYGTACIGTLFAAAYVVGVWTLAADPSRAWFSSGISQIVIAVLPVLLPVLCALATIAQARGADRARIAWVTASLSPLYLAYILSAFVPTFDHTFSTRTLIIILNTGSFIAPLGLAYALLTRRILGVGFAFSRAMVFSAVSLILVGVFVFVEWQLGVWFSAASRTTNLAITAALAAGLALSIRSLYARIDAFVDTVLFRRQREARALMTRMIEGLPYVESAETIADVLARGACESLRISSGALFRRGDDESFQLIAMQGWAPEERIAPRDLQRISVALEASPGLLSLSHFPFAATARLPKGSAAPIAGVPLYARRQLAGFVLYSGHADGTGLDPDERALLVDLGAAASRGYDALELANRVEKANEARALAQAENLESLKAYSEACERFVPGEFLKFLEKDSLVGVRLGDHVQREMTVLFADIRSFTGISERMSPGQIFAFLNAYLSRAGPLIREHGGFIDKYIGDAVMSLFPAAPDEALRAAIALQHEVRLFNRRLDDDGIAPIALGCGIHFGELILGTIGERGRMETTVISDAVNIAARLETATKLYGCSILLSRQTVDTLAERDRFMLRPLGSVHVKGRSLGVDIYECYDADPADLAVHKRATQPNFVRALTAFEGGDPAATEAFAAIVADNQRDGAAAYFLARCSERFARSTVGSIPATEA
jgi:class 3 adenylate cyclase